MEAKKIDFWVIALAVLLYGVVNLFALLPREFYFENMIMLSLLFAIAVLSYFSGMMTALGLGAIIIFFYGSFIVYNNVILGEGVESHVYYWLVLIPGAAVLSAVIGGKIRILQEENIKMRKAYSEFVTVDENTGLDNVKAFYSVLNQFMGLSRRYKIPLSLMMVKVMYFDDIKSIIGEEKMRHLLKLIGQELVKSTRTEDCSYMLEDGRTFGLLLFGDVEGAQVVKKRIKESIKQLNLDSSMKSMGIKMELKMGVVQYTETIQDMISMRKLAEKDMEYDV